MQRTLFYFLILCIISIVSISGAGADPASSSFYNFWLPGVNAGMYYFFNTGDIACGGALRYDILYGVDAEKQSTSVTERGRWEVYIDVGLFSLLPEAGQEAEFFFRYVIGFTTSIETPKTLKRQFLIPYIGLEAGGIYFQEQGNCFGLCPLAGINIYSDPKWTMSVDTGLFLTTVAFDEFFGLRTQINLNCVL